MMGPFCGIWNSSWVALPVFGRFETELGETTGVSEAYYILSLTQGYGCLEITGLLREWRDSSVASLKSLGSSKGRSSTVFCTFLGSLEDCNHEAQCMTVASVIE